MKKSKSVNKPLLPLNLQFFAESANSGQTNDSGNGAGQESQQSGSNQNQQSGTQGEAIFTQAQVSAMMAREKKEGKDSIIKSLGFGSEKEARDAVKLLQALTDSQKTDEEKVKGEASKALAAQQEAERRAKAAEDKLAMVQEGVKIDSLDDVYAIASLRISNDKDLTKVLKEMKKKSKYSVFFTVENSASSQEGNQGNSGSGNTGTGNAFGSNSGSGNTGGGNGNYGADLAKRFGQQNTQKTSLFV